MTEQRRLRAAVVFRSHTGTTERYGREIAAHLTSLGVDASVTSIGECDLAALGSFDLVLLGCWTQGWFVVRQHPDTPWVAFARDLPDLARPVVGLFTTYTLATGSMFSAMRRELARTNARVRLELRSRDGRLSDRDRNAIADLVEGARATVAA